MRADPILRRFRALLAFAVFAAGCHDNAFGPEDPDVLEGWSGVGEPPRGKEKGRVKQPPIGGNGSGEVVFEPWIDFDVQMWEKRVRDWAPLGHTYFLAQNVKVAMDDPSSEDGGALNLILSANSNDGAEIRSLPLQFGFGTYEVRMAAAPLDGTLSTFFLYEGDFDHNGDGFLDEIDIELLPGYNEVWLTVWSEGQVSNSVHFSVGDVLAPGFDVTDYHIYKMEYGAGLVMFWIDGSKVATLRHRIPEVEMFMVANAWWPTWLSDGSDTPPTDQAVRYDWIRFRPGSRWPCVAVPRAGLPDPHGLDGKDEGLPYGLYPVRLGCSDEVGDEPSSPTQ